MLMHLDVLPSLALDDPGDGRTSHIELNRKPRERCNTLGMSLADCEYVSIREHGLSALFPARKSFRFEASVMPVSARYSFRTCLRAVACPTREAFRMESGIVLIAPLRQFGITSGFVAILRYHIKAICAGIPCPQMTRIAARRIVTVM